MAAESEISSSLASGKFILRATCCSSRRSFSGNDRPHHCAGSISARAHRSGRKHWSAGTGSMFARDDLGRSEIGRQRTLLIKEMLLGTLNGALTGVTGGIAMFIFATMV